MEQLLLGVYVLLVLKKRSKHIGLTFTITKTNRGHPEASFCLMTIFTDYESVKLSSQDLDCTVVSGTNYISSLLAL